MSKKSIAEFKKAFKAVRKPDKPDKQTGKLKELLDKAVGDEDKDGFAANVDVILKAGQRDYLVKLVAYKYAKHFENSDKRPTWLDKVPVDVRDEAMNRVVPDGLDSGVTQVAFEKAIVGGDRATIALINGRDPVAAQDFVKDKLKSLSGKVSAETVSTWTAVPSFATPAEYKSFCQEVLSDALTGGKESMVGHLGSMLSMFSENEIVGFARVNPALFFKSAMDGLKNSGLQFIQLLSQKSLRDKLAVVDPKAWAELVARTPMLASLAMVEERVAKENLDTQAKKMDAMFDAVLDPKNLPLSYSATAVDSNTIILSGQTDKSKSERVDQKKKALDEGRLAVFPETPATDCHHMLYITQQMMQMVPGPKPDIHNVNAPEMLMTKPLSSFPGRGTLDRSFTGNVFDDKGKPTGCVLFTGDDKGKNSHTWLSVDGEYFDPVMGTKGDDVQGAVRYEPTWVIPGRLANCMADGLYAVKDDKLKPAKNAMGFSTGYYLTSNPAKYLTPQEVIDAGLGGG